MSKGKIAILLVIGMVASFLSYVPFIHIISIKNGEFLMTRYPLIEDPWNHPRLQELRRREHLDEIVAPGRTQFEKIVRLRHWTRRQWTSATTFYYPPWDAVEILDLARQKKSLGFCAQYAIVFLQACRALGLHARYIDIGHFLTCVWSDDYNRWIVMDPTNDVHYENKEGLPLKGRELANAGWKNNLSDIYLVDFDGNRTPVAKENLLGWKKYSILLNNNQLTDPILVNVNGTRRKKLIHQNDYRDYPLIGKDNLSYGAEFLSWHPEGAHTLWPDRPQSGDVDDFRDRFNQTILSIADQDAGTGRIKLKLLAENAPEFKSFSVRANGKEWVASKDKVLWELIPGMNTFLARVTTTAGWDGPSSTLQVYYKPRLLNFFKKAK
jgi:hypothetical protein